MAGLNAQHPWHVPYVSVAECAPRDHPVPQTAILMISIALSVPIHCQQCVAMMAPIFPLYLNAYRVQPKCKDRRLMRQVS